jgi:hypothetical protein
MGASRVAMFVRGTAKDARDHMSASLETARKRDLVAAAGVAAVLSTAGLSRNAVVEIAESALTVAEADTEGSRLERIVVRTEAGERVA